MKKHVLGVIGLTGVLVLIICLPAVAGKIIEARRMQEWEAARLQRDYRCQNRYLGGYGAWENGYHPLNEDTQNKTYTYLHYYRRQTGEKLSLDDVREYFSSEFEEDGSIRIYTNGNWPEIENYMNWAFDNIEEMDDYCFDVMYGQDHLYDQYPELKNYTLNELSLHNLEELLRATDDKTYEPNFIFE